MEEKINQEDTDTQEERAGADVEPSEGYTHLTQADLDPDFEPTDKESKDTEAKVAQADTSESVPEDKGTEASPSKVEEYQINGTTYTQEELQSRMVKDYKNLASHTGKQAEDIGKYKAKVEELQKEMEGLTSSKADDKVYSDEESTEEKKKEYDIYTEKGIRELSKDMAKEALTESQKVDSEKTEATKLQEIAQDATKIFMESHKLDDDAYINELVEHGSKTGMQMSKVTSSEQVVNYLEHIHAMKSGDYTRFNKVTKDSIPSVDTTTMEKVSEGQKVQKGLGNVNSSESDNVDYDNMDYAQWEKIPREKRNQLLGIK